MILVLIAVAATLVLSCAYVVEQSTALHVSRNVAARAQARMIAESGLAMAVAYVRSDDNWRNDRIQGLWIQDRPFAGGTFTIYAEDGQDQDGDGVVDGDGNLADDWMDALTLTAAGEYHGAKHTVQAIVPPPKRLLMVVNDPASLSSEDTDRYTLLRNWGWRVRLLRAKATVAEFDQAAANVHLVYFPPHTSLETDVKNKLKVTQLPVVIGHRDLVKELKLATNSSVVYQGTSIGILKLTRIVTDDLGNETTEVWTHHITSPFPVGALVICQAAANLTRLDGSWIGTQDLAVRVDSPDRVTLAILECGALQTDKRPARARRVALPWGAKDFFFQIGSLNANGRTILARSLDWAGSSWRGYLPGIAVWEKIEVKDMALVDGFESAAGAYGGGNVNGACTLSTNGIGADYIMLSGGVVNGNLLVSPDADMNRVIKIGGGAALTGVCRYLSLNVPVLTPEQPTDLGGSTGDRIYEGGVNFLGIDHHFNNLIIRGDAVVVVNGDIRILCDGDFRVEQNGQLVIGASDKLTLYAKGKVELKGNAKVNVSSADPAKLTLFLLEDDMVMQDSAQVYTLVQTYDGALEVSGEADFHGTFVGRMAKVQNSGAIHVDTSNSGTIVTLGGGYDLEKIALGGVRWLEKR